MASHWGALYENTMRQMEKKGLRQPQELKAGIHFSMFHLDPRPSFQSVVHPDGVCTTELTQIDLNKYVRLSNWINGIESIPVSALLVWNVRRGNVELSDDKPSLNWAQNADLFGSGTRSRTSLMFEKEN